MVQWLEYWLEPCGNPGSIPALQQQSCETFAFDCLDPSEFINMAEAKPYIVLKVVYKSKGKDSLTLGWQMVDIFQQETTNIRAIWTPKKFSIVVPLHPGKLPYNIMDYTLKHVSKDLAQGHSNIQLIVCDTSKERNRQRNNQMRRISLQESDFLYVPWIPYNSAPILPSPTSLNCPFDLYIDALHYIPDNATITK
ncbi:uncharacterized protein LOC115636428 isoform X3 [Gopherus evgoodei]|nr:uncharacterized protein LOC115636428 isoform X3 [Gopherus evgoodei]